MATVAAGKSSGNLKSCVTCVTTKNRASDTSDTKSRVRPYARARVGDTPNLVSPVSSNKFTSDTSDTTSIYDKHSDAHAYTRWWLTGTCVTCVTSVTDIFRAGRP